MNSEDIKIKSELIMKLVEINTKFITTSFVIFLGTFFTLLNESIKFEGITFIVLGCIGLVMIFVFIKYCYNMNKDKKRICDWYNKTLEEERG